MEKSKNTVEIKAFIALALVSFFWGTTYLAIRLGLGEEESGQVHGIFLSAVRQSLAGLLLVGFLLLTGVKLPARKTMFQLAILGILLLSVGNGLATWALQYIPSGLGSVMSATGPIFIAIFSHFIVEKVRWSPRLIGGMLLGWIGIMGISYDYLEALLNPKFAFGIALNMSATIIWSLGSVYAAKWKPSVHLLMGAGLQMLFGGAVTWAVVGIVGIDNLVTTPLGPSFWWSIAYLIVFGSFISYSAFIYTLEKLPPAQASLYAYINPVVAVVLGWIVLSEPLSPMTAFAIGITILGVYWVNTAFQTQRRRRSLMMTTQKEEEIDTINSTIIPEAQNIEEPKEDAEPELV